MVELTPFDVLDTHDSPWWCDKKYYVFEDDEWIFDEIIPEVIRLGEAIGRFEKQLYLNN